jgi:DNA-binding beta-propeller fold protein YncE
MPQILLINYNWRAKNMFRYLFRILSYSFLLIFLGCASTPQMTSIPPGSYAWPSPPATPRIEWLSQWSNRYDFGGPSKAMEFLVGKERVEKLRRPSGIVADNAGNIYVADSEIRVIFVFDIEHHVLRFLGLGSFGAPTALAVDNTRGLIFVADPRLQQVLALNKVTGGIALTIGGPGEFKRPSGLVYDEQRNRLYVADSQEHVVKAFDKDGRPLFTIGKRGAEDGEFNFPTFLALDRAGNLYVVDSFNFRVQIFDANGKFLRKFGKLGDSSGYFSRPEGIGVDSEGHIYVADSAFNNFQIFDQQGKLLLWVGNTGRKPGEFYVPSGLFVDKSNKIYVSDTFNGRAQVFQYLKATK